MNIGNLITEKRKEKDLTMKSLAEIMGVSESTVSRWESGDIENIKRKKIEQLSKALDISVYKLMGWPEPNTDVNNLVETTVQKINEIEEERKKSSKKRMIMYSLMANPRFEDIAQKLEKMPKEDQERVLNMIESIIENSTKSDKE
jgi:transcriptional regulator with XRE-family HTH domain